jgi:NAD(P)-dependent dehydrogenase (short-subunit alcohol dehydrogenase family)
MTQTIDLSGRTLLITGASSGLGLEFARAAAAAGAKLALAARRTDRLEGLAGEIEKAGGRAVPITMDVQDEPSVIAGYDAAQAALGPIDSVICNAGMNSEGLAVDIDIEEFDRVVSVNLKGAFLTAREGARRMMAAFPREAQRGRILIVASIGAHTVLPGASAYCASKAGVAMLGKSLAREWVNRGINVNVVCPGYIETELNADWFASEGGKKQLSGFPRRRLMQEADLDPVVLYLLSDLSRTVTGSVITLDDGQSL